jgi:hypothetical protein
MHANASLGSSPWNVDDTLRQSALAALEPQAPPFVPLQLQSLLDDDASDVSFSFFTSTLPQLRLRLRLRLLRFWPSVSSRHHLEERSLPEVLSYNLIVDHFNFFISTFI